ncbi:polyol transporter 5-like [Impatiens glandulifera]|uniref:polyol transporter 5-like n=1 Tax=Impatiens glandulifera TaxID=253017 RepID=UPI001FB075BF|nr:polyol transporter 5-like [Impatiens glandulifera]
MSDSKKLDKNGDPEIKPKKWNKYALSCAILASMTSILLGYDTAVMSGAGIYIKQDLKITDVQLEVLMGIINLYSLFGSAVAGRISDWIGRRYTVVISAVIFFFGALIMGIATNYPFIMVGRFVAGVGVGFSLTIAPVYTAELSPASFRGFLTSFPEVFINSGVLLGYISNFAFSKLPLKLGWRVMLLVGTIPPIFMAIGVLAMPESPRWLVMQGRLGEAKRILRRTSDSPEEASERLADIKMAAGIPIEFDDDIVQVPENNNHGKNVWRELILYPTPAVRHILLAGVGIHFFQQASGIDAAVMYSPRIFEKAGVKSDGHKLLATIAVGFSKTIFILVAMFLLDKVGRRVLLLSSVGGMIVSVASLSIWLTIIDHNPDEKLTWAITLSILSTLSFVGWFSIGLGPIAWVYSSEIFPLRLRAQGTSMGVAMNRSISGVVTMTFLSLTNAISIGGVFFMYTGISVVAWVFFYTMLPETRGRTLEEMQDLFGTFWRWRLRSKELEKDRLIELEKSHHEVK